MKTDSLRKPGKGTHNPHSRERIHLQQLLWTLLLFGSILLGKQFYPHQMMEAGERILAVVNSSADLEAAVVRAGEMLWVSGDATESLRELCVAVFGPLEPAQAQSEQERSGMLSPALPAAHAGLLSKEIRPETMFADLPMATQDDAVPAVGTVVSIGALPDHPLPEGNTMNKLSLGAMETVAPLQGKLTSEFGYRNHPITGEYLFHSGADIGAPTGTPIAAFADGVVEYTGEDASYGLYLRIDHGDGVKSFYAHCQTLCAQTGQRVAAGETVALVGSTGVSTGPHLHLELKCGDVRVNPAYYLNLTGS